MANYSSTNITNSDMTVDKLRLMVETVRDVIILERNSSSEQFGFRESIAKCNQSATEMVKNAAFSDNGRVLMIGCDNDSTIRVYQRDGSSASVNFQLTSTI
jgi:hypothetical protein